MLNEETDDIDFNLFSVPVLRKIIVLIKNENVFYRQRTKKIVQILKKFKDAIKLQDGAA